MWTFLHLRLVSMLSSFFCMDQNNQVVLKHCQSNLYWFFFMLENYYYFQLFLNKSLWPFFHLMQHVTGSMQQLLQPIKSVVGSCPCCIGFSWQLCGVFLQNRILSLVLLLVLWVFKWSSVLITFLQLCSCISCFTRYDTCPFHTMLYCETRI